MYRFPALFCLACSAVAAAAPAQAAPLSPTVKKDVQCFLLLAAGVGASGEEKAKQAGSIGIAYFYGRLQVEAPGLDLVQAVRDEIIALEKDKAAAEKIAAACDSEVAAFGEKLKRFGEEMKRNP